MKNITLDNITQAVINHVFVNIRDDEGEHVKTMVACQQPEALQAFKSPHALVAAIDIAPSESIKL